MKPLNLLVICLSLILIAGCNTCEVKQIVATVNQTTYLENLSSASAAWYQDGTTYIAGDDVPWLFQLDNRYNIVNKTQLSHIDSLVNGRTPGSIKADFESMDVFELHGREMMMVVSSGSKAVTRDTAYLFPLATKAPIYQKNVRDLFDTISAQSGIKSGELNIEGLAIANEHVYLLQRGNVTSNFVVSISHEAFFDYFLNNTSVPEIMIYRFELPQFKGVSAGFSGACISPDQAGLLFTASLENTKTATADGEVLGSYVGYIPFCGLEKGVFSICNLTYKDKQFTKKLESITLKSVPTNGVFEVIGVADNDDGSSDIIELTLSLK
jgi:hypothetical protein